METLDPKLVEKEYENWVHFVMKTPELEKKREAAKSLIAPSKREKIFCEHSVSLYRYTSANAGIPMLIVPSLVNQPWIMDLLEGESFIQAMLDRGIDVYMIEWGQPTLAQSGFSLEFYLDHYLGRALRRILRTSGQKQVDLAGYCLGGTLATLFAAMHREKKIRGLITMVTPLNFHDRGLLSWWANEDHFDVDKIVDSFGNVPAEFFSSAFPWLVPTASIKKFKALYEKHEDDEFLKSFFALDFWIKDNISFPGEVYREIIRYGYQKNILVNEKKWQFSEHVADLSTIDIPVLNLAAQYDHVSPVESCSLVETLLENAKITSKVYPTSHLGFALGKDITSTKTSEYWDFIANWLKEI